MKLNEAITFLNDKKKEISSKNFESEQWKSSLIAFIEKILEPDSEFVKQIKSLDFNNNFFTPQREIVAKEDAPKIIDEIIKHIKILGISIKDEQNGIGKRTYCINKKIFWTIVSVIGSAVFYFGFYIGTSKFDRDKIDLYEENKNFKSKEFIFYNELTNKDSIIELLKSEIITLDSSHKAIKELNYFLSNKNEELKKK